jgi:hypothetical protein
LNLYIDHFSYFTKIPKKMQMKKRVCPVCGNKFRDACDLRRHMTKGSCKVKPQVLYPRRGTVFEKEGNLIHNLYERYRIQDDGMCETNKELAAKLHEDMYKYDYVVTYDMEAMAKRVKVRKGSTKIITEHIPVSFAIASNLYKKPFYHFNKNPRRLVKNMFKCFDKAAEKAGKKMLEKMQPLLDVLEHEGYGEKSKLYKRVIAYCKTCPIVGFNNGKYDENLLTKYGFMKEMLKRDKKPFIIKSGCVYKVVKGKRFMFLDQMLYAAPGVNLKGYCTAYLGKGAATKFFFPYEKFTTYKWLDEPVNTLEPDDFYSRLKGRTTLENDDKDDREDPWEYFVKKCKEEGLWDKKRSDLLEYYNKMDVVPFTKAIMKQKEVFYTHKLDMHKDGITLSGLAQVILAKMMTYETTESTHQVELNPPIELIRAKIRNHKREDKEKKRSPCTLTVDQVQRLIGRSQGQCYYCHVTLTDTAWSLDRVNNRLPHTFENCLVCCRDCNAARKDSSLFHFHKRKQIDKSSVINLVDYNETVNKIKSNIVGGPSLVFHKYHEAGVTKISKVKYDLKKDEWSYDDNGRPVEFIQGFDANALYLYCLGQCMPCGILNYQECTAEEGRTIIADVTTDKFFGMVEVDIETLKHLWNKFAEMPPIFVNKEIDNYKTGSYNKELIMHLGEKHKEERKLISCFSAEKILLLTPLLKWYLSHGLVVTKSMDLSKRTNIGLSRSLWSGLRTKGGKVRQIR